MPNWCDTTYKVVGDKYQLQELYITLKNIQESKKSKIPNDFGYLWIGNVIDALGYDWEQCRCRGEILDFRLRDNILIINQQTAWCEQEGFRESIEKRFDKLKVYYQDAECGNAYYVTNSFEYFPYKYILDSYNGLEEFKTIKEVAEFLEPIVGKVEPDYNTIDTILDNYNKQHEEEEEAYWLHEYQLVKD